MKMLKKTVKFGISNSQKMQNTETAIERRSTDIAV